MNEQSNNTNTQLFQLNQQQGRGDVLLDFPKLNKSEKRAVIPRITPNDIEIFYSLADYKILSLRQIRDLHFREPKYKLRANPRKTDKDKLTTASNRVRQLESAGFIKSLYAPLSSAKTRNPTRPSKLLIFPPKSQNLVKKILFESGRASEWERISGNIHTFNKEHAFSSQSLAHEEGISEVFISIHKHTTNHQATRTPFLIRTSPRHPELTTKVTVNRIKTVIDKKTGNPYEQKYQNIQSMNPDFFWCVEPEKSKYDFFLSEFDNDTSDSQTFFSKLEVYYVFLKQGLFPEVCQRFGEKHALNVPDYKKTTFRQLTVVDSMKRDPRARLHRLFADSLKIPNDTFLNFTTLEEFKRDPYGEIWYNRTVFRPLQEEYDRRYKNSLNRVKYAWLDDVIPNLKRAKLF